MIFVDEARIHIKAGGGGKGCESYYRAKHMRFPRPDGGDGGDGGHIVLVASKSVHTLLDYRYKQHYKAERGGHASSKNKKGRNGKNCFLRVPCGTIIKDDQTGLVIRDLTQDKEQVIVAQGGRGGIGNATRKVILPPKEGEEKTIHLELKVMADVGLIGFPNAGKSTIISAISRVKSRVANYPFTTKHPVLGFVMNEELQTQFIAADLPGIIEGAHLGKGLGDKFLKHAERTKILVHVLDMAGTEGRDPLEDYQKLNHEIECYGEALSGKTRVVVANKMDMDDSQDHLKRFRQKYRKINIIPVSASEKTGLDALVKGIKEALC